MYDYNPLVKLGWDDYANVSKAERSIADEHSILKLFSTLLPKQGRILDVGCGCGKPITKFFYDQGFEIEGLDISPNQIAKAKRNLEKSKFTTAEMTSYQYPQNYYDGLICLHSLENTERIFHKNTLKKFNQSLKPGSPILISLNTLPFEGIKPLTKEIQMFYSNFSLPDSIKLINESKLLIIFKKYISVVNKKYLYVIAKKEGQLQRRISKIIYSATN